MPNYPLGNFHMTGATTPLPGPKTFQPAEGIPLEYIMDEKRPNRVHGMAPTTEPGVVWLGGVTTISGPEGKEALVAHYSRRKGLEAELEQGLMRFDDEAGVFEKIATLEPGNAWRRPRGSVHVAAVDGEYVYFIDAFAQHASEGRLEEFHCDPAAYEAFAFDPAEKAYRWQRELPPTTQEDEQKLIEAGKLKAADAQLPNCRRRRQGRCEGTPQRDQLQRVSRDVGDDHQRNGPQAIAVAFGRGLVRRGRRGYRSVDESGQDRLAPAATRSTTRGITSTSTKAAGG